MDNICKAIEEYRNSLTKEQFEIEDTCYMRMSEYAFLLYEKEGIWYIAIRNMEDLNKYLYIKVTVIGSEIPTYNNMRLDFKKTNFDDTQKWFVLWLAERNRKMFFDIFKGKYQDGEELEDYKKWVIQV